MKETLSGRVQQVPRLMFLWIGFRSKINHFIFHGGIVGIAVGGPLKFILEVIKYFKIHDWLRYGVFCILLVFLNGRVQYLLMLFFI